MPFTRVGDESAKAIAGIRSLALIDLKSTKYSHSGLVALQDGLRRNNGAVVKLLPGNKVEVSSAARPIFASSSNTFEWLSDAISSYILLQGPYAQNQKRNTVPTVNTTRYSMFSSFSNLSLKSSSDNLPSRQLETEQILKSSAPAGLHAILTPSPSPSPSPIQAQVVPSPTIVSLTATELPSQIELTPTALKPIQPKDQQSLSVYDDFSSDEDEQDIEPKQPAAKRPTAKPTLSATSPAIPDTKESKRIAKQPAKQAPPRAANISASTKPSISTTKPVISKVARKDAPQITRAPKAPKVPKVAFKIPPSDDKENEPLNSASGKRKSPRLQSKPDPKARKIEVPVKPLSTNPQIKTKRKAATPKSANKRTKLTHTPSPPAYVSPYNTRSSPSLPAYVSPYNTRSSPAHTLVAPPLESLKKQKRKSPNVPTPLAKAPKTKLPVLDLDASAVILKRCFVDLTCISDSFDITYSFDHSSKAKLSDDLKTATSASENSVANLSNCDLSIISPLADFNLHTSNDEPCEPPLTPLIPDTELPTPAPTPAIPDTTAPLSSIPCPNFTNLSCDTSIVPDTPSFCTSSPPHTPTKPVSPPPSTFLTPTKQIPAEPRTPPTHVSPLSYDTLRKIALKRSHSATRASPASLPPRPHTAPASTRPRPTTPTTPTTPTKSTPHCAAPPLPSSQHARPLTPAERERNRQLNHEFLRMRRLLLY
eukprot:Phypoly_transcript_02380.p1 GENE.Phypoly_transcript_02380~~Phypoly_transcript_02380.p1  ORF type:complete len:708 (-),score=142.08 Phypoly_transcript_02380:79-2202(-)